MNEVQRTKILYVITKSTWGGAGRYVFDLATHFSHSNDVAVLLGGNGILKTKLDEVNVRTISLEDLGRDIHVIKDLAAFTKLLAFFKKEKPDVVHLNSSKIGAMGALAARIAGVKKVVFTGHGWAFNEDRTPFSRFVIMVIHWITILLSSKTIAVSEKTKKDIGFLPGTKNKMVVIYNGIGAEQTETKLDALRFLASHSPALKEKLATSPLIIGTLSELHKNKGLDFAIQAIAKIKEETNCVFVVMGSGDEREYLEKQIAKHNLQDTVFLLGFVSDAQRYIKAFDIFTLTSRTEALPYVLLEVGKAGVPIIASNVGGISEIIDHEKTGLLISPGNTEEIETALRRLAGHPELRDTLASQLKEVISTKFSNETMYKATEALY